MKARTRHRAACLAMLAVAAAWSSFAACSGNDGASDSPDAGAAGASGTLADTGGTGASGGAGATGGSSGTGGAGAQWGAYPVWESIPGGALDCKFERLANAAEVRVFTWQACADDVGCEQAVFNPALVGSGYSFSGSSVQDDGDETRVGLCFFTPSNMILVANELGAGNDGFRLSAAGPKCLLSGARIWNRRLAVLVAPWDTFDRFGGLLVDAGSGVPSFFEVPQPLPPGAPAPHMIGDSRWLWWWAPKNSLTSVSTADGSNFAQFATANSPDLIFSDATSTGPLFLFNHQFVEDGGTIGRRISYSDGVSKPKPYLVAGPGAHFGAPAYAHSHVAFMRGINPQELNLYETVELWASPYTPDPQALQPTLVGPMTSQSMSGMVGGWGHVGKHELLANDVHGVQIWNLETKTKVTHPIPEGQIGVGGLLGMTRTHFWLGTAIKGKSGLRYLLRYPVE